MIGYGASMGKIKIPYYTVIAGRGYWRPTGKMRALGFQIVRCGADGPEAWAVAAEWNKRWQAVRKGDAPALVNLDQLSRDQLEAARRYPAGSIVGIPGLYPHAGWAARAYLTRKKSGGRRGSAFGKCGAMSLRIHHV